MKKIIPIAIIVLAALVVAFTTGVGPGPDLAEAGEHIIAAKDVSRLSMSDDVVLVDMQEADSFALEHIEGAVSITREEIVVNSPYPNLLAPAEQIAKVLGSRGIGNDTLVLIYDDSKGVNAARLWWTMKVYGHENVKVISGGLAALKQAGMPVSTVPAETTPVTYEPKEADLTRLAFLEDIEAQVENPADQVILLDTRTADEYHEGTIPGSILVSFENNLFDDGTFRPVQHILIEYKERGITADKEIIIFCAVSVRGAQTYLTLYNAGYRNISLYDGAWAEYSAVHLQDEAEGGDEPQPDEPAAPGG